MSFQVINFIPNLFIISPIGQTFRFESNRFQPGSFTRMFSNFRVIPGFAVTSNRKSKRKAMNRNWCNQKANLALKTKAGNK